MLNIWQQLKKPIWCLAPMFGATDSAFRQLLAEIGKPDLMFTEFTNVQALFSPDETAIQQLTFTDKEQPLIAQIWGLDPELFEAAADFIAAAGFAGVDINFACPVKAVVKKGAGGALIDNPSLAGQMIQAALKGAAGRIPVSVKTRLGNQAIVTETWFKFLLNFDLAAISVHCRTTKALSLGPTHWEEISKIVRLRNQLKSKTLIIGNGDIFSREIARQRIRETKVDGVMIGRGVFADPYIFNPQKIINNQSKAQKLKLLKKHLDIYQKTWGKTRSYHPLKRFFKIYVNGFHGAMSLRVKLMNTRSITAARAIIDE
ncbi:tRNA-dihydrouridine synthase [Candidatus Beckwithbacteria bacterium CG_4_9_14_0_2_um_filter_47_11]|uniref:tRNA-dihydrouridine synthase n=1 Tax=Candidatus Beckwithbacteria bacterium CG_4_9_14_0_2_um_filter_47_11 TaxID=1974494 RepID=A0A2M8G4I1_9BACT|nr:MAG: tRNA-dihydrouridine synthase [Candidatus Beckwithbacteria bacterium CG_4_9_14_0_2_um_filter_47_11]